MDEGPRRWSFVLFDDLAPDSPWQQRLVLGRVVSSATRFVIVSPDADVYVEDYGRAAGEVLAVRWSDVRWPPPVGVNRRQTYRFARDPTAAEEAAYRTEGVAAAADDFIALAAAAGRPGAVPAGGALEALECDDTVCLILIK